MLSQIGAVLRQARHTFTCGKDLLYQNMEILKALLDKTTSEDVNLEDKFKKAQFWAQPQKAPVTYIDIYEDPNLTVGVFVLKPGMKLPLHDHPEMHGLIKVIYGKIRVRSYTIAPNKCVETQAYLRSPIVFAEHLEDYVLDENSESCVLEPLTRNLHEIECLEGPAAFIDILAPPYETVIPSVGERTCNYYSVLSQNVANSVFKLQKVICPSWYWTDSCRYTGPDLPTDFSP